MENRLHPRIPVESQCQARFQFGGQAFNHIHVANLGSEGCCIRMPTQGQGLRDHSLLENLELVHPGLPKGTIQARVAWVHGQESGIKFTDVPDEYSRGLSNFVLTMAHPRFSDPDGLPEVPD